VYQHKEERAHGSERYLHKVVADIAHSEYLQHMIQGVATGECTCRSPVTTEPPQEKLSVARKVDAASVSWLVSRSPAMHCADREPDIMNERVSVFEMDVGLFRFWDARLCCEGLLYIQCLQSTKVRIEKPSYIDVLKRL
jgi:hypothetical protein